MKPSAKARRWIVRRNSSLRTDKAFNAVGEPQVFYCQLADDYLPQPEAVMITGITPQVANARGVPEVEFAQRIHALFTADLCDRLQQRALR